MQGGAKLKRIDLTGQKFGKLTVKEFLAYWNLLQAIKKEENNEI